jgi:hypothetical protein
MSVVKGMLKVVRPKGGPNLEFLFNPESISVDRKNNFAPYGEGENALNHATYRSTEPMSMSFDLFFDTTDTGENVLKYTGRLMRLMDVPKDQAGADWRSKNAMPPVVQLYWGQGLVGFPAVITSVDLELTYFSAQGIPLRAEAGVDLLQFQPDKAFGPQNPTSGTPYPHRTHRIQPGETLDRISARYYGDATRWRALASANGIEDPLAVRPGSLIVIPEITSL